MLAILTIVLMAAFALRPAPSAATAPQERRLSAGAATSNITPPLGELIVGNWTPVPATHIHDELHARCLEMGLEIKKRSPFAGTFTASLANGAYGYLPTVAHHDLGGYETWLGTNKVEVQAAPKIVDALLQILERLNK